MVEVLVWILVGVVSMSMIMCVWRENLFDEVDEEESCDKCIYSYRCLLQCFWKDMDERYSEHRTRSESDEEIEPCSMNMLESEEDEATRRDEGQDEEREEHSNDYRIK